MDQNNINENAVLNFDIEKDIHNSLSAIKSLHSERVYKITSTGTPISNHLATIEKKKNEDFKCKIYCEDLIEPITNKKSKGYGIFEDIHLKANEADYFIGSKTVLEYNTTLTKPVLVKFNLTNLQKGGIANFDNQLLRLLIPVVDVPRFENLTMKG
jgi:hypothetical protein